VKATKGRELPISGKDASQLVERGKNLRRIRKGRGGKRNPAGKEQRKRGPSPPKNGAALTSKRLQCRRGYKKDPTTTKKGLIYFVCVGGGPMKGLSKQARGEDVYPGQGDRVMTAIKGKQVIGKRCAAVSKRSSPSVS